VSKARLARLYELMEDSGYPIETARIRLKDEKAKLLGIETEITTVRGTSLPSWSVEDYRTALRDGLGEIASLLDVATDEEKNALYRLLGLQITYTRIGPGSGHLAAALRPRLEQRGAVLRVGGPTRTRGPRSFTMDRGWSRLHRRGLEDGGLPPNAVPTRAVNDDACDSSRCHSPAA
jgi:hypothetical protein